jgi:DNA replication protein DnaC
MAGKPSLLIRLSAHRLRFQQQIVSYDLLIVDEFGFVPLSKTGAELLFETFGQRYERGSPT